MGTNAVRRDATAETVSANVKRLRAERNLGLRALASALRDVGRPLGHSAVDQIEKGTRRVDVDDLVALAAALGVSPITLLMPLCDQSYDAVEIPAVDGLITAGSLWDWLRAHAPLRDQRQRRRFVADARPEWS